MYSSIEFMLTAERGNDKSISKFKLLKFILLERKKFNANKETVVLNSNRSQVSRNLNKLTEDLKEAIFAAHKSYEDNA